MMYRYWSLKENGWLLCNKPTFEWADKYGLEVQTSTDGGITWLDWT